MLRRTLMTALAASCLAGPPASAEIKKDTVKIGVLTDLSSEYSGFAGAGSIEAARMAVEDWGGTVAGKRIEIVSADHQQKADVAANLARQWLEVQGVDLVTDVIGSSPALAVQEIARRGNRMFITQGSAADALSGSACSPVGIQWNFSSTTNANALGKGVVQEGGDSWYFVTVDNAGGISFEEQVGRIVKEAGGKVLGSTRFPLSTVDFSSYLVAAQASGAKVISLVSAGQNTVNALKQAGEFGVTSKGVKIVLPFFYITDAHALTTKTAQGLVVVEPFYWDLNDETRAFSRRFYERMKKMPTNLQAGVYTAVTHFLKGVQAADSIEGNLVAEAMRRIPINDFMTKDGRVRPDGSVVRDRYIFQVKTPAESTGEWDLYKPLRKLSGEEVLTPLAQSDCKTARAP